VPLFYRFFGQVLNDSSDLFHIYAAEQPKSPFFLKTRVGRTVGKSEQQFGRYGSHLQPGNNPRLQFERVARESQNLTHRNLPIRTVWLLRNNMDVQKIVLRRQQTPEFVQKIQVDVVVKKPDAGNGLNCPSAGQPTNIFFEKPGQRFDDFQLQTSSFLPPFRFQPSF